MKESNKRHYESKLKSKPCSKEQRLKFLAFYDSKSYPSFLLQEKYKTNA